MEGILHVDMAVNLTSEVANTKFQTHFQIEFTSHKDNGCTGPEYACSEQL